MSPSFDEPRAILISSDIAQTGQGNRWTCIERTSIEQPHSSRNFNRRLSLSMQFSRDWPGWAKPTPVHRSSFARSGTKDNWRAENRHD